jgi:hypothetical protein
MLFAGQSERDRLGTAGDEDVSPGEGLSLHDKGVRAGEADRAIKGFHPRVMVALFLLARHRIGEGALERHQLAPVDAVLAHHPVAAHPARVVDDGRTVAQHLLGVASAQRAGAAIRSAVDHGDALACLADAHGRDPRRGSRADNDQIIGFGHELLPCCGCKWRSGVDRQTRSGATARR